MSIRETLIVFGVLIVAGLATVVVLANDGAPETYWRTSLDAPVTAGLLLERDRIIAGSEAGDVVALDATSGHLLWRTHLPSPPRGNIDAHDELLFVRTDDGGAYALNLVDGAIVWQAHPGRGATAPAPFEGIVVVATSDGAAVGLDATTGAEAWRTPLAGRVEADPARAGTLAAIGDIGGRLSLLDSATGAVVETLTFGGDFQGPPHFSNGLLVAATRTALVALEGRDERWRASIGAPNRLPMRVANDLLLVDASPDLVALDVTTGHERWRYTSEALVVTFSTGAGLAVVGMHTGEVHGIDLDRGERLWRYRTNESIRGAPVIREEADTVYFGSRDGNVYAIATGLEE